MLTDTAQFFLDNLLEPYAWLLLLRCYLNWQRAPMRNPLGQFILVLTNPLVLRLRRLFPAIGRLDTASFSLAYVFELAAKWATLALHHIQPDIWLLLWVLLRLAIGSVYILLFALFVEALISWTYPNAPFGPLLRSITYPFLRPLQRLVPPRSGVDFSFLILFFLCYIVLRLPLMWLELAILSAMGVIK